MHTPELTKTPFKEIRLVIPIRLTTDPWSINGSLASQQYDEHHRGRLVCSRPRQIWPTLISDLETLYDYRT